jgi:hypothetical protein
LRDEQLGNIILKFCITSSFVPVYEQTLLNYSSSIHQIINCPHFNCQLHYRKVREESEFSLVSKASTPSPRPTCSRLMFYWTPIRLPEIRHSSPSRHPRNNLNSKQKSSACRSSWLQLHHALHYSATLHNSANCLGILPNRSAE